MLLNDICPALSCNGATVQLQCPDLYFALHFLYFMICTISAFFAPSGCTMQLPIHCIVWLQLTFCSECVSCKVSLCLYCFVQSVFDVRLVCVCIVWLQLTFCPECVSCKASLDGRPPPLSHSNEQNIDPPQEICYKVSIVLF